MQSAINKSHLNKINQTQRNGIFAFLTLFAIVLFLHFPFEGYTVQKSVTTRYSTEQCAKHSVEEVMKFGKQQSDRYFQQLHLCTDESELQLLPVTEWASDAPIFPWFGSFTHTLVAMIFIAGLAFAWIIVFRSSPIDQVN